MSVLSGLAHRLRVAVHTLVFTPLETAREVLATVNGVRRGEISSRKPLETLVATVGAIIVVFVLLFPVYWIFLAALSPTGGSIYSSGGLELLPSDPTLEPFLWVVGDLIVPGYTVTLWVPLTDLAIAFDTPEIVVLDVSRYGVEHPSDFKLFLWNSLTVAVPTVILSMCLIVPAAYALSRREFILRRKILFVYVLLTQVGGGLTIALLIGLYAVYVQFGFNDSKLALSAYYAATAVPFNTWLLKTYMDGIPVVYEEAAAVDGAPPWYVATEIVLPLSTAGLATVFVFTFLTGWTEFVVAQTLLGTENYTLPVGLFSLVGEYSIPWARFSAFALTFAMPVMIVYLFAQRYINAGLSLSRMKG